MNGLSSLCRRVFLRSPQRLLHTSPAQLCLAHEGPAPFWTHEERINAIDSAFPSKVAASTIDLADGVFDVLLEHGFTRENTLLGVSSCPDEANRQLEDDLTQKFGPFFNFGGLAGFPFAGKTGFMAYASHIPDTDGRLLLVSASHVGVTNLGKFGDLARVEMEGMTSSCGAAIGAYSMLTSTDATYTHTNDPLDFQQSVVVDTIKRRFGDITSHESPMAVLADVLAEEVYARMQSIIPNDVPYPIAHLNGVLVNTEPGQDDIFIPMRMVISSSASLSTGSCERGFFGSGSSLTVDVLPQLEATLRRTLRASKMATMVNAQIKEKERTLSIPDGPHTSTRSVLMQDGEEHTGVAGVVEDVDEAAANNQS